MLYLFAVVIIPAGCGILCLLVPWIRGERLEERFLTYWLVFTPMLIAFVFGDPLGRNLAASIGHRWTIWIARLVDVAVLLALMSAFSFALMLSDQLGGGIMLAAWIFVFLLMGGIGFVQALRGR